MNDYLGGVKERVIKNLSFTGCRMEALSILLLSSPIVIS